MPEHAQVPDAIVDELRAVCLGLAEAFERTGHPYFRPPWFDDIVGMVIDDRVDRDEVAGALTESYRLLAPKRLAARVGRASGV